MQTITSINQQIKDTVSDLNNNEINFTLRINRINSWLKNKSNLYTFCKINWNNNNSLFSELPDCNTLNSDELKFKNLYESIKEISDLHKLETYCKSEVLNFETIKNVPTEVNQWLAKNEVLGSQTLAGLTIDYLDYEDNPTHLQIPSPDFTDLEVLIDRNEFKYTIQFIQVFNQYYYIQELQS